MFDEFILASAKQTAYQLTEHRNAENASIAAQDYQQWLSMAAQEKAAGRVAPPRRTIPRKLVVLLHDPAMPTVGESADPVYVDPEPEVKPTDVGNIDDVVGGLIPGHGLDRYDTVAANSSWGTLHTSPDGRRWFFGGYGIYRAWMELK